MSAILILTLIGSDRPGVVEEVASLVAEHDGEWLQSRMAHLGGQFAGILKVRVSMENATALSRALEALDREGITVTVRMEQFIDPPPTRLARIELVGHDKPGIIRQISSLLRRHQLNVEEMITECSSAPMTGETLFRATLAVGMPEVGCPESLQTDLEKIAHDLMVDIQMIDTDARPPSSLQPGASS